MGEARWLTVVSPEGPADGDAYVILLMNLITHKNGISKNNFHSTSLANHFFHLVPRYILPVNYLDVRLLLL